MRRRRQSHIYQAAGGLSGGVARGGMVSGDVQLDGAAGNNAPVLGFYVGRASKQLYSATGPSLPGLYSSNNHWISHTADAGIQVDTLLRAANNATACPVALPCSGANDAVVHRNWGIFTSTQADLLSPGSHQPIADEQNELTGINLSRLYTYQLVYPDPAGGWQLLYLSSAAAAQLQSWAQNGTSLCGSATCYATLLHNSEGSPAGTALLGIWEAATPTAAQAAITAALTTTNNLAMQLVTALAAGDNHFDQTLGYYGLGLSTSPEMVVLNAILANANATAAQKTLAKAEMALFGSVFWDDDWFPIENNSGQSVGTRQSDSAVSGVPHAIGAPGSVTAFPQPAADDGAELFRHRPFDLFRFDGSGGRVDPLPVDFFEPLILIT